MGERLKDLKENCTLQNHKLWSDIFFRRIRWWRFDVKIRPGRRSDGEKMARASFCESVVTPRNHARSRERFEMLMISGKHFVSDLP